MKNKDMAVISGLTRYSEEYNRKGVSYIPLLGSMFKKKEKREMLILVMAEQVSLEQRNKNLLKIFEN